MKKKKKPIYVIYKKYRYLVLFKRNILLDKIWQEKIRYLCTIIGRIGENSHISVRTSFQKQMNFSPKLINYTCVIETMTDVTDILPSQIIGCTSKSRILKNKTEKKKKRISLVKFTDRIGYL